jgi:hypothetical protein
MTFKELYERLWELKREHRQLTLLELGASFDIDNVELISLALAPILKLETAEVTDTQVSTEDLIQATTFLSKMSEHNVAIIKIYGEKSSTLFEQFKKTYEGHLYLEDGFNPIDADNGQLFFIKGFDNLESVFRSLSMERAYVFSLSLENFYMFFEGEVIVKEYMSSNLFEYLQVLGLNGIDFPSLKLADVFMQIKKIEVQTFDKLMTITDSVFVQSFIEDVQQISKSIRRKRAITKDQHEKFYQDIIKITKTLPEEIYKDKKYAFVRDFLI